MSVNDRSSIDVCAYPDDQHKSKQNADDAEQLNGANLISLSQASSSQLRKLAASNLKYYPEHLDVLLQLLTNESDKDVLNEVEQSLMQLCENAVLKRYAMTYIEQILESRAFDNEKGQALIQQMYSRISIEVS